MVKGGENERREKVRKAVNDAMEASGAKQSDGLWVDEGGNVYYDQDWDNRKVKSRPQGIPLKCKTK